MGAFHFDRTSSGCSSCLPRSNTVVLGRLTLSLISLRCRVYIDFDFHASLWRKMFVLLRTNTPRGRENSRKKHRISQRRKSVHCARRWRHRREQQLIEIYLTRAFPFCSMNHIYSARRSLVGWRGERERLSGGEWWWKLLSDENIRNLTHIVWVERRHEDPFFLCLLAIQCVVHIILVSASSTHIFNNVEGGPRENTHCPSSRRRVDGVLRWVINCRTIMVGQRFLFGYLKGERESEWGDFWSKKVVLHLPHTRWFLAMAQGFSVECRRRCPARKQFKCLVVHRESRERIYNWQTLSSHSEIVSRGRKWEGVDSYIRGIINEEG